MNIYTASNIENSIIESLSDGNGFRLVLFTCGCPHHCHGCQNPKSWNIRNGIPISVDVLANKIIQNIDNYDGLTISGGDPFYQEKAIEKLLNLIKTEKPDTNIWVYTGYKYEDIKNKSILKYIDVLVDGPFKIDKKYLNAGN